MSETHDALKLAGKDAAQRAADRLSRLPYFRYSAVTEVFMQEWQKAVEQAERLTRERAA